MTKDDQNIMTAKQANELVRTALKSGAKWRPNYGDAAFGDGLGYRLEFHNSGITIWVEDDKIEINKKKYHMDKETRHIIDGMTKKFEKTCLVILIAFLSLVATSSVLIKKHDRKQDDTIKIDKAHINKKQSHSGSTNTTAPRDNTIDWVMALRKIKQH